MLPFLQGKIICVDDERLAIVLGYDIEDDARHKQQQSGNNEHNRTDEGWESSHHAGVPEVHGHHAAQRDADDAENGAESSKER